MFLKAIIVLVSVRLLTAPVTPNHKRGVGWLSVENETALVRIYSTAYTDTREAIGTSRMHMDGASVSAGM